MADTAALVVALSAQLTKFEKDMKGAVDIANTRTKEIETSFTKMNAEINSQLSGLATGFSSRLGALGGVLSSIGPVGLTIAAGIGAATLAIGFLNEKVDKFVEKQRAMREAAEITGLTLNQLKAVGQAATRTGVDFEKAERGIIKMAVAIDDLRSKGTGPLVDTLNKLDPQLVKQLINADNSAEAFDILAKALSQMEGEFAKAGFASDVFGKRNIELLRVLRDLTQQGGLVKAALNLEAQGKGIDKGFTDRLVELDNQIKQIRNDADRMFGEAFSLQQRQAQKETAELMKSLGAATLSASNNMRSFVDAVLAYIATKPGVESANKELENLKVPQLTVPPRGTSAVGRIPDVAPPDVGVEFPVRTKLPTARPTIEIEAIKQLDEELDKEQSLLNQDILFMERWAGVLGDAITPAEQLQQQQNKINKALTDYAPESQEAVRLQEAGNRSIERLNAQQQIQAAALRERLLLLSEEQIVQLKLAQARLDAEKAGLRGIDLTKAEIVFRKQAREAIEAQAVSLSKLPESLRFSQQALDSFKQLDQLLVTTAGTLENTFADIATSSKTASEAFKALADSIIRDLIRITIRMAVTGPLLKAFAGFFGSGGGGGGFNIGGIGHAQHGGPVSAGHPYVVGERGPELFVPQSAGKIVPNAITAGKASGGTSVEINNFVAADTQTTQQRTQGPDGERVIISIVKKAQARGELDDTNRSRFGLRPQKVR